jgi:soluble lytic murein transglycosylase-like protein
MIRPAAEGQAMAYPRTRPSQSLLGLAVSAFMGAAFLLGTQSALGPGAASVLALEVEPQAQQQAEKISAEPLDRAQEALVKHLSRRFMVEGESAEEAVRASYRAAGAVGLDPLLVLAVISVESAFNPFAESGMGAKGLMQIIPKYHRAKLLELGGEEAVLDPQNNIAVGTRILQEYVYRTGTLEAGLQFYNGASRDGTAQYAQKVMAERLKLEEVMRAAMPRRPRAAVALNSHGG